MSEVTNDLIYQTLLDIKGDIGGLKASSELHLTGLKNHGERIGALEIVQAKQKGAAKVWAIVGTAAGSIAGSAFAFLLKRHS